MSVTPASASSIGSSQGTERTSIKYQCPLCSKDFLRRENLSRHLKTHDSVKAHKCATCNKEFTRSDLRQRHEATHVNGVNRQRSTPGRLKSRSTDEQGPRLISTDVLGSHRVQEYGQESVHLRDRAFNEVGTEAFGGAHADSNSHSAESVAQHPSHSYHGVQQLHHLGMLSTPFEQIQAKRVDDPSSGDDAIFFLPDHGAEIALMDAWFDEDFYSALQETGTEWGNLEGEDSGNFLSSASHHPLFSEPFPNSQILHPAASQKLAGTIDHSISGRVSRLSSPPNEASAEDRVAFAWNPRANQILTAKPINLPHAHHLYQNHDSSFDISRERYENVKLFLSQSDSNRSDKKNLVMPELSIANIFIGLFFRHFEPQMPVIHRASLELTSQLPDSLIAIMIVIGAICSGEKHTRRFAIVLLDITRMSLQRSVELDNTLMREPMVIYATVLICHTGLWCGNKRAFELAEILRGAVVTYCRRNYFAGSSPTERKRHDGNAQTSLNRVWKSWISDELHKRLCWVVYGLDCQFPALLYLPSTISITELAKIECPCDEEFWQATTARKWKRLLGPASVPPSKTFLFAVGPFLGPIGIDFKARTRTMSGETSWTTGTSNSDCSQPKSLNSWTRFLVLMTIHVAIYELSQQLLLAREATHEGSDGEEDFLGAASVQDSDTSHEDRPQPSGASERRSEDILSGYRSRRGDTVYETIYIEQIFGALAKRKAHLEDTLKLFADSYLESPPVDSSLFPTSRHFQHSAEVMHRMGVILLEVSVSDLQDSLGKSGGHKIQQAMSNISRWANRQPNRAQQVTLNAIRLVSSLTPVNDALKNEAHRHDIGPYEIISFFISVVLIWGFVTVAKAESKAQLLYNARIAPDLKDGRFIPTIEKALDNSGDQLDSRAATGSSSQQDDPPHQSTAPGEQSGRIPSMLNHGGDARVVFRSAAEVLTRFGTWGASLNLAILLHQRAKM